jgi:hypothetical protein
MSDAGVRGPQVDAAEDLYRAITVPDWWAAEENPPRPSSAAFRKRKFSCHIASEITLASVIRHLCEVLESPRGGIVSFNCGRARELSFDARRELDEQFPDNTAHAHVYYDGGGSELKRHAKRLACECRTIHKPGF